MVPQFLIAILTLTVDELLKFLCLGMGMSFMFAAEFTLTGVGSTLLLVALTLQLYMAFSLVFRDTRITVDVSRLMDSFNATLVVLVSSRSIQGRLSPLQLLFFASLATVLYEANLILTQKFAVSSSHLIPFVRLLSHIACIRFPNSYQALMF